MNSKILDSKIQKTLLYILIEFVQLHIKMPVIRLVNWIQLLDTLTLEVTKKNPLKHTVPIKIITSLILVIKKYE